MTCFSRTRGKARRGIEKLASPETDHLPLLVWKKEKNLYPVQSHRADEDGDSASRSYKIVYQSVVLNKLTSTLRISAKTMSKICNAGVGRQLARYNVWKKGPHVLRTPKRDWAHTLTATGLPAIRLVSVAKSC